MLHNAVNFFTTVYPCCHIDSGKIFLRAYLSGLFLGNWKLSARSSIIETRNMILTMFALIETISLYSWRSCLHSMSPVCAHCFRKPHYNIKRWSLENWSTSEVEVKEMTGDIPTKLRAEVWKRPKVWRHFRWETQDKEGHGRQKCKNCVHRWGKLCWFGDSGYCVSEPWG